MNVRCSCCGEQADPESVLCGSCGASLSLESDKFEQTIMMMEPDLDSEITEIAQHSHMFRESSTDDESEQLTSQVERAFAITGVLESRIAMGRIVPLRAHSCDEPGFKCTPFEAYLLSIIDGKTSVDDVVSNSGLTFIETVTALASLHEKSAVLLTRPESHATKGDANAVVSDAQAVNRTPQQGAQLGRLALRKARSPTRPLDMDPDLLMDRADAAMQQADFNQARELARLAVVHAPNSERGQVLTTALNDPQHAQLRAKVVLHYAVKAYRDQQYEHAVRLFNAAIEEYEAFATAHYRLSVALIRMRSDYYEALIHCRRAVEIEPENELYRRNLQRLESWHRRRR